jgi:hypothetical protein
MKLWQVDDGIKRRRHVLGERNGGRGETDSAKIDGQRHKEAAAGSHLVSVLGIRRGLGLARSPDGPARVPECELPLSGQYQPMLDAQPTAATLPI